MRPSRKILLKLTAFTLFLVIIYCLQTTRNGVYYWHPQRAVEQNVTDSMYFSSTITTSRAINNFHNKVTLSADNIDTSAEPGYYNVWCIFTKVTTNSPMRRKFKIFVESLLRLTSVNISFHVISDNDSKVVAENVIKFVILMTKKHMKVQYYDVNKLAAQLEDIVSVMSPHFSSKPGTYYSDALFFLSLGLHWIAPNEQPKAIMFDADTKFRTDIKELFREFDGFGDKAVFGLAPELTPVYRHVLYLYRSKHPNTKFGEPSSNEGYSGYNSGVILFDFDKLRKLEEYEQIVSRDSIQHMTEKYYFKGHLGDQDFYTLLGMERPELIHTIDCGWNRQLCTWWRDRGYTDIFANYSYCGSETKLWHGNCNTPIPDN